MKAGTAATDQSMISPASASPGLQIRHAEGAEWWVAAKWPDGRVEDIAAFESELKANEWIAKDFPAWLHARKSCSQKPEEHRLGIEPT